MMHGTQKSDSPIVAARPANKPERSGAESAEPRGGAEGNATQSHTCRTQSRESVFQRLDRVRHAARHRKRERFTALMHLVDVELLRQSYFWLQRKAAAGVDGVTWDQYGEGLEERLVDLHTRIHRNAYQASPSRRQYIPKADGRMRPLGIAALEDKIVQRALVEVLNAVYEQDFLGFSYGFRPHRNQHQALDALSVGITRTNVSWIVDADIKSFFDTVSHEWLIKFLEHRIGDHRILRLIGKWLKAGTLEEGQLVVGEGGTPQGAVISPLLANIYLHYVFDLWAHQWRQRHAQGNVVIVRYADDIVVGTDKAADAKRFMRAMRTRLEQFMLTLHPDKTRMIEFGRFAAANRAKRGLGKPETFDFLGFTHISGQDRRGKFMLHRITRRDRMIAALKRIKDELRRRWHQSIPEQGRWLRQVVQGYFGYHAVPSNFPNMKAFRNQVTVLWRRALRRRGQRDKTTWRRTLRLAEEWLPRARILHPWPNARFDATHPRQEPGARIAHAGICAGGAR
ncbi:group II intron reverse transcriptase/maturase [Ralstonia solanacearum]|uniref:Maturase-Group II intron (Modular protein) n=3 Tax=Ralstonia TaxID=48736 RepID=A0A0S4UGA7_RALSL|nr:MULTISPECIES: group II intron reverse transcriptase/maturase [Ralstonia]ARS55739.1 group II intron reverse transcriptase/maturase [Ralstonia solanacearum FJAT-91]NKA06650.1 group II intron reverse transcriptase/maturase [Ralstonia solanacearum]ARS58183.1 group II intron reverse transcriptase/maturase [Ralstonia solanacearum FJAT-91]ARS59215.1 group II intron reverse transcriptase/maturase [Ralstonia solanacearum FJAT-91]ARS59354.1 group II intron reverse transcriptase/maturase [Ralstonia so